jgi:spoIIIJ-associated protein
MEEFKKFEGKDLDDAIGRACEYFDVPRGKLEIDIIRDSKSGIFGIVGARKAMIRARRAQVRKAVLTGNGDARRPDRAEEAPPAALSPEEGGEDARSRPSPPPAGEAVAKPAPPSEPAPDRGGKTASAGSAPRPPVEEDEEGESQTLFLNRVPPPPVYEDMPLELRSAPRPPRPRARACAPRVDASSGRTQGGEKKVSRPAFREPFTAKDLADEGGHEGLPELPAEELDGERLRTLVLETVRRLAEPVVGPVVCDMRAAEGRVHVGIDCGEDSGMLIGRGGQTLAALQYLASRIVSRAVNAAVRINLDAGDYKHRQDDKLRSLALNLAERAKNTGKAYSTRPLSSYHRRIIHLALQDDKQVQTHSMGEGALKRVVVQRRR